MPFDDDTESPALPPSFLLLEERIRSRLGHVCAAMPVAEFNALVRRIALTEYKYDAGQSAYEDLVATLVTLGAE